MESIISSHFSKFESLKLISESLTSIGQIIADLFCKVGRVLIEAS